MSNFNSDVSDVRPDAGASPNVSPTQLPIRGEKRIIPSPISPIDANAAFEQAYTKSGLVPPNQRGYADTGRTSLVQATDFFTSGAGKPFVDYIVVRLYNRGLGGNGLPNGTPAVYRFLINPSQVVVNRTTLDAQAMTRAGWQIGVWGEDSLQVSLTGKTPGAVLLLRADGQRTSRSRSPTATLSSYRSSSRTTATGSRASRRRGPLAGAANFTRRIIKMHSDVELIVGNFMWYGMFDSLTLTQSAEEPFLVSFNLTFVAWKERFRKGSPYKDTIHNDVKHGVDYGAWLPTQLAAAEVVSTVPSTLGANQISDSSSVSSDGMPNPSQTAGGRHRRPSPAPTRRRPSRPCPPRWWTRPRPGCMPRARTTGPISSTAGCSPRRRTGNEHDQKHLPNGRRKGDSQDRPRHRRVHRRAALPHEQVRQRPEVRGGDHPRQLQRPRLVVQRVVRHGLNDSELLHQPPGPELREVPVPDAGGQQPPPDHGAGAGVRQVLLHGEHGGHGLPPRVQGRDLLHRVQRQRQDA